MRYLHEHETFGCISQEVLRDEKRGESWSRRKECAKRAVRSFTRQPCSFSNETRGLLSTRHVTRMILAILQSPAEVECYILQHGIPARIFRVISITNHYSKSARGARKRGKEAQSPTAILQNCRYRCTRRAPLRKPQRAKKLRSAVVKQKRETKEGKKAQSHRARASRGPVAVARRRPRKEAEIGEDRRQCSSSNSTTTTTTTKKQEKEEERDDEEEKEEQKD